ncbi:MAG TPA: Gfo/Idh/MocA family oxidoreductase [Thermoanaerobaculia bacterium]|jgi:predicted dehydrogenase
MAKIGVIGTGWGARVQVPAFRGAGHEIIGISGFDREKTRRTAEELGGGIIAYDDWRSLIASPEVELVTITTPPSEHRAMAAAALAGGKHVILEKPTAMHAGEAEELVQLAAQLAARHPGQIAIIDHELRFLPSWREARERFREIGAIRYAEVRYASPGRGDRKREWNWWSDAERGGGIWGAVGSHYVDALRYFGIEIEAAQALLATAIGERPYGDGTRAVTSDDIAAVHLRFATGGVASLLFAAVAAGNDEPAVLTIHGEEGAMRFVGEEVLLSQGGSPYKRIAGASLRDLPGNSPGGAFGSGTVHLAEALRVALDDGDGSALAPAATFADGLMQQRVLDAARRSAANDGRWERV